MSDQTDDTLATEADRRRNLLADLELVRNRGRIVVSLPGAVVKCESIMLPYNAWPIAETACRRAIAAEEENARLRDALRRIASAAGNPDPAEGCRVVIGLAREVMGEEH